MLAARVATRDPIASASGLGSMTPWIHEPGYALAVDSRSGAIGISSPRGTRFTTLPLVALAGENELPPGLERGVTTSGSTLTVHISDGTTTLETAVLHAYPAFFTVDFTVRPGPDLAGPPRFFFDGTTGVDLTAITEGYAPDPGAAVHSRWPGLFTDVWTPLAPPPLDLEMRTAAGWFGIGLEQVPDATAMNVDGRGAIAIDYPLRLLSGFADSGAGGTAGGAGLHFPAFVFSFGTDAMSGLRAYRDALVSLGAAPPTAPAGPAWWYQPIACTWGEQVAEGALRGSPKFTAAWVLRFAQQWRALYGTSSFTLVIDSRWQQQLGSAEPDAQRFGDWTGMRMLIDDLHAQGLKVVLWWPLWGRGTLAQGNPSRPDRAESAAPSLYVDPTAADFEQRVTAALQRLLGSGAGDLDADGLKLDWAYDIPASFSNPSRGWGDAALYRYLSVLHSSAHSIRPTAYIESSAPAPQFAAVADGVRLYDAWSDADWEERAAIVSAADPGALIDGDGWDAMPDDALVHAVTSVVYGVPAVYYSTHWADGTPVAPSLAREIGSVAGLAFTKGGAGTAALLPGGEWRFSDASGLRARTLADRSGVVVWSRVSLSGTALGEVIVTRPGPVEIPLPWPAAHVTIAAPSGPIAARQTSGGVVAAMQPGVVYRLTLVLTPAR